MITRLSYPEGMGVNDIIDPDLCTVRYTSFDNVVGMISNLGKKAQRIWITIWMILFLLEKKIQTIAKC